MGINVYFCFSDPSHDGNRVAANVKVENSKTAANKRNSQLRVVTTPRKAAVLFTGTTPDGRGLLVL